MKLLISAALLISACGCSGKLDSAIDNAIDAKNASDVSLVASYRTTVNLADRGWQEAFKARKSYIDAKFVEWMRIQGFTDINDPEPSIKFALMVPAINQWEADNDALTAEKIKWENTKRDILAAIDDYETTSLQHYETVEAAFAAKERSRQVVTKLMETLGSASVSVGTMFLLR